MTEFHHVFTGPIIGKEGGEIGHPMANEKEEEKGRET